MRIIKRPQILDFHGCKVEMFKDEKQWVEAASELIAENRKKYPELDCWQDVHSKVAPNLLSKVVYRREEGSQIISWEYCILCGV